MKLNHENSQFCLLLLIYCRVTHDGVIGWNGIRKQTLYVAVNMVSCKQSIEVLGIVLEKKKFVQAEGKFHSLTLLS